jgi:hypothetical protein
MNSRWPNSSPFAAPITVSPRAKPRASRVTRFFYGLAWLLISCCGIAGLVFSLYRNDVLLRLAQQSGMEERYLDLEHRLLGTPGWGTPRSLAAELPLSAALLTSTGRAPQPSAEPAPEGATLAEPSPADAARATSGAAAPHAAPNPPAADAAAATPRAVVPASPTAVNPGGAARSAEAPSPARSPAPLAAASPAAAPRSTPEGVAILSLDALPTEPTNPRVAQPRAPSQPVAPTQPRAPVAAAAPARAINARSLAEAAPAPRRTPSAAPKAAPAPKLAAAPPKPAKAAPPKPAAPSTPDNPLKAAIRSAIMKDQSN